MSAAGGHDTSQVPDEADALLRLLDRGESYDLDRLAALFWPGWRGIAASAAGAGAPAASGPLQRGPLQPIQRMMVG